MRVRSILWALVALVMLAGASSVASAQQRRMVVARPTSIGVDPSAGDVFADLLRGELAKEGYAVIPTGNTPPEPCGDPVCGGGVAQATQSDLAVVLNLSALGQRVIVRVTVVDFQGRPVFNDRASGDGLEDLDPLASRVAMAIAQNKPIEDTATVSTVTTAEAAEPKRRKALFTTGVKMGMFIPMGDSYADAKVLADIGAVAMYELKTMAVLFEADFKWATQDDDPDVLGFGADLGLRWFTSEADSCPYIGGGFGFRGVAVSPAGSFGSTESDSGLGGYFGGGMIFLRTSDIHIMFDARYDVNMFQLGDDNVHGIQVTAGFSYTKGMKGLFGR